jgi:hypothetical protein
MGEYYIFANVTKREFFNPGDFGEGIKRSTLLYGYHAMALGLLFCKGLVCHPLCGAWSGDEVTITGDHEHSHPATEGQHPDLYWQAHKSFRNIGAEAIAMLCLFHTDVAGEFAKRAKSDERLLMRLSGIVFQDGCKPLEKALAAEMGQGWATWHASKKGQRRRSRPR